MQVVPAPIRATAPLAYVPAGAEELAEELRGALHPRVGDAVIDLLDRLADRPLGTPVMRKWALDRYGRFGKRGAQLYVWDVVRDALVARGVLIEWPGYIVGVRAKKYGLSFGWRNRPLVRVDNPVGPRVAPAAACPVPVPTWLETCVAGAELDDRGATEYLLTNAGISAQEAAQLAEGADFNTIGARVVEVAGSVEAARVTNRLVPVWRWKHDGQAWTTRDPSGWRVHTPISNLPSELRRFLRFPGRGPENLVEIDATNSQAVFLAAVADKELECAETREFAEICGRGEFYEETFRAVYARSPTLEERSVWKERCFERWLYANLGCQVGSPAGKAIGARFPRIHKWMGDMKAQHGTAYLPCRMQRAEAKVWVDALVPRLAELGIPVFTVHDCAIVPEEFADAAMATISGLYAAESIKASLVLKRTDRP